MKHPVDIHVGQKIRQQRWLIGITQQQLAAAVGIKFQQIQKYETGMNRVSASRLWEIAQHLQVPISYFFEGLDGQAADSAALEVAGSKQAMELVRAYLAIPEPQRKRLLELARVLSDAA